MVVRTQNDDLIWRFSKEGMAVPAHGRYREGELTEPSLRKRGVFVPVTKSLPSESPPATTLGGVVTLASLDPVGGGAVDPRTLILGACLAEGSDGLSALEPGWLVATDGRPLTDATDPELRGFVREAAARQAAGIVLRLGAVWQRPPEALVDEAGHAHLPLLALPPEATLSTFLRQVNESTGIHDVAVLSTAVSLQSELIGALSASDMETELVRRIATSLDVSAVLYDDRQDVIAAQGEAPVHLIGQVLEGALSSSDDSDQRQDVGRWQVAVSEVAVEPRSTYLALAWPVGRDIDNGLIRSTRFAVRQLMRAHARTLASALLHDQIQRAQVLLELLEGVSDIRLQRMRDGLVLLHFPAEGTYQVHVIGGGYAAGGTDTEPDPVLSLVQSLAAELSTPALMGVYGGEYAILHGASDAFTNELVQSLPDRVHGASSAFHDLTAAPAALRQAQMSMSTGRRTGHFTPFHRVGFVDFILGHLPVETLQDKAADVLGDLTANEVLIETLVEYLRHGLDIQETGRAMHLHANSIRYRLSKVEELLGRTLTDPETITLLYLTLHDTITQPNSDREVR